VVYAPMPLEFDVVLEELRRYKMTLAIWVQENDPQHWAASKFGKEWWDRINTNLVKS